MRQMTGDSIALRGAGVVQIKQPAKGHRFTLDSILLADFCRIRARDRVLEAGSGTGIISLLLAKKHPRSWFTAVEAQPALHRLCVKNIEANGLANLAALHGNISRLNPTALPGPFDVLVMNPPYARAGTGRLSPDAGRQISRHEMLGPVESWLDLHKVLKQGGRCCIVFTASRLAELCALLRAKQMEPKRLRLVHPSAGRPASLALIESMRHGGTGLTVLPPLFVHGEGGRYSKEMQEIYGS